MKIHRQGLDRTFRHAGVAPLPRRAGSMRDDREPHPHLKAIGDRQQSFCCTGGDAGEIFTEFASDLVSKNHRRAVCEVTDDRSGRAGFDAVTAACAALKKGRFGDGSRGTQPVCPDRSSRLLARRILVKRKLPRGLGHRDDGVFQKIPPTIFRITSHDALQTTSHRRPAIYRLRRNGRRPHTRHPSPDDSRE